MKTQILTLTVYKAAKSFKYVNNAGIFHSCMLTLGSKHYTTYVIGETTTNKKMPLFALKTLSDAENSDWNDCFILKCVAIISPKQPRRRTIVCCGNAYFDLFWKQVWNKKKITVPAANLPPGTIFCSSITPIEVIRTPSC